jgi:hypothetical protein
MLHAVSQTGGGTLKQMTLSHFHRRTFMIHHVSGQQNVMAAAAVNYFAF